MELVALILSYTALIVTIAIICVYFYLCIFDDYNLHRSPSSVSFEDIDLEIFDPPPPYEHPPSYSSVIQDACVAVYDQYK